MKPDNSLWFARLILGLLLAAESWVPSPVTAAENASAVAAMPTALDQVPLPASGKRVLIVTGDDYPGHLWRETAPALQALLAKDERLAVRIVAKPEALASPQLAAWDTVILHFQNWEKPGPSPAARSNLVRFVQSGKGLMLTHFACGAWFGEWPEFANLAGRAWYGPNGGRQHDPHGKFRVEWADPAHPIARGLTAFDTTDELYTCLQGQAPIHVVAYARSKVDSQYYPLAFVRNEGAGRVFHCVLGHDVLALTNSTVPELLQRGCAWATGLAPVASGDTGAAAAQPLAFRADGEEFTFDTGQLAGRLRAEKRGFGLTSVTHPPTGANLSRSVGLMGIYRVFSDGKRYGSGAWDWPSEAQLQPDGSVLVKCAAAADRPFALTGQYRWADPLTLDLAITVTPQRDLHRFEAFVASYFDGAFSNAMACVTDKGQSKWLRAEKTLGDWLMFPRDPQAIEWIQDGRWVIEPNPVQWVIQSNSIPLGLRRAPAAQISAAMMARSNDCFALAMPHETEGHYSMYLSLFGGDLKAGQTTHATARLQFFTQVDEAAAVEGYRRFTNSPAQ